MEALSCDRRTTIQQTVQITRLTTNTRDIPFYSKTKKIMILKAFYAIRGKTQPNPHRSDLLNLLGVENMQTSNGC